MYKVFVNDKPIILTTSNSKEENYPVYIFKNIVFEELIYKLKNDILSGVYLFSTDLEADWEAIRTMYRPIVAGGGLVTNPAGEYLFIYRGNKWDLPKGRIEEGESIKETAIREVEEECGITGLELGPFLLNTYHLFVQDGEKCLKETYWYAMTTEYDGPLKPQLEEGITEVGFKSKAEVSVALQNTYANIILVYDTYQKMSKK